MTDNEIIKALQIHINEYDKTGISVDNNRLDKLTLDLIYRQQAEIERLRKEVNLVSIQFQDLQERYEEAHAEIEQWKEEANKYQKLWCIAMDDIEIAQFGAIQELAKRLKNSIYINTNLLVYQCEDVESMIDDIVKEMVGETE